MTDVSKQISAGGLDCWGRVAHRTDFEIRDKIRVNTLLIPNLLNIVKDAIYQEKKE